jgi:hypothetical protein
MDVANEEPVVADVLLSVNVVTNLKRAGAGWVRSGESFALIALRARVAAAGLRDRLEGTAVVGNAERVRERQAAYCTAGRNVLGVSAAAPEVIRQIDLLATATMA